MKNCKCCLKIVILGLMLLPGVVGAQTYFQHADYGDLLLGFRKTGTHQGTNELVVNAGNVTNLVGLAPGAQVTISNISGAQLTDAFPDGNGDLQWSVFSTFQLSSPWVTPLGTYYKSTLWLSLPSPAVNMQSTPFARSSFSLQGLVRQKILGVASSASTIGSSIGTTNMDNNTFLVREPLTGPYYDPNNILSIFIKDSGDPTIGDFNVNTVVIENVTPHVFSSPQRSDFYQSSPSSFVDPTTGTTSGNAYFVGYFLLNPNGTMTFTRASNATPPPPPVTLTLGTAGVNTYNISFASTNSAVYTLYITNSAGLSMPISTWPTNATSIVGDGTVKTFTVNSTSSNLFFSVGAR